MNELIQRLNENMQLFGLSQRTQETYSYRVVKFIEYFNKPLDSISGEDIRQYFLFLKNNKNYSRAAMTIALCAIKFFYEKTLYKEFNVFNIIRPKRVFKLPVILSREEVRKILMNIHVLRHRACLTLIYSCGLRLNEGVGLKVNQVDSNRMLIHVQKAKGNHDRYVLYRKLLLNYLGFIIKLTETLCLFSRPPEEDRTMSLLLLNLFLTTASKLSLRSLLNRPASTRTLPYILSGIPMPLIYLKTVPILELFKIFSGIPLLGLL